mmetsp:Transcript_35096/g.46189  ORF Transcript_35096/g.46189 Transcript_35096/m.46189 type:complete len:81 (-) Transcript_35096:799-1041(-)
MRRSFGQMSFNDDKLNQTSVSVKLEDSRASWQDIGDGSRVKLQDPVQLQLTERPVNITQRYKRREAGGQDTTAVLFSFKD